MAVNISIKLTPKQAGKLYMSHEANMQDLADIAAALHYPDCWDTAAYPTLLDAVKEIGCNPADCCKSESLIK